MRVYLDANIVIYLVDRTPGLGPRAAALVTTLKERGDALVVSHAVRMECMVGPLARGQGAQLEAYARFFGSADVETLEVSGPAFDRAAQIRAAHSFRAMDALNLAAALEGGCDAFVTNDGRLRRFPDLRIITLAP